MLTKQTRQEEFGTITYDPAQDRFSLTSPLSLEELLPKKLSAPVSLHWLTTLKCNARCPYCYLLPALLKPTDQEQVLDRDQVKATLEQFANLKVPRLYLTGGEPTLHPFLNEVISQAYEKNIKCVVNTNGIKMPPEIYEALVAYESRLSISLDSYQREVHNTSRRQNSFDSIITLLEKAAHDHLDTRVISVMQHTNEAYWLSFGRFLLQREVNNWFIQADTSKQEVLETTVLETKLKQEFPNMRIRVLPAIFDSFLYMLPDGTLGSNLWSPERKVYGKLPQDFLKNIWEKNEKNHVRDHQGILHINAAGDIQ